MKKAPTSTNQTEKTILGDPQGALPFLHHLATYGEISQPEIEALGCASWINMLLRSRSLERGANEVYTAAPMWLSKVSRADETDLLRISCFSYPVYRQYLAGVLAQNFYDAGRADLSSRLENWVLGYTPHLASEINAVLDVVQPHFAYRHLLSIEPDLVINFFQSLPERAVNFSMWDKVLLGISGSPEAIFMAVLEKFGPLLAWTTNLPKTALEPATVCDIQAPESVPALLPAIHLRDEDGRLPKYLFPAPWNVRRTHVRSGIPLFTEGNQPIFDLHQPIIKALQDALFEQPYYRAVIHLAVDVSMARSTGEGRLTVLIGPEGDLGRTAVLASDSQIGQLAHLLPVLVRILGFQPIPEGHLSPGNVTELLDNLIAVNVLELNVSELCLTDTYADSLLNRPRLQEVVRAHKTERKRLVEFLIGRRGG